WRDPSSRMQRTPLQLGDPLRLRKRRARPPPAPARAVIGAGPDFPFARVRENLSPTRRSPKEYQTPSKVPIAPGLVRPENPGMTRGPSGVSKPRSAAAAQALEAPAFSPAALNHLKRLEAESIHIFREVAAECERPVMLYSIGKD